jgi:hypothetical protein
MKVLQGHLQEEEKQAALFKRPGVQLMYMPQPDPADTAEQSGSMPALRKFLDKALLRRRDRPQVGPEKHAVQPTEASARELPGGILTKTSTHAGPAREIL